MRGRACLIRVGASQAKQRGFTLAELLVAMAVGTIVMAGAFAAYSTLSRQYSKYIDQSEMHRTASQVLQLLARDLRMAGARDIDSPYGDVLTPIEFKANAGEEKSDQIQVVYDEDVSTRIRHFYELVSCATVSACSPARSRLYRSRWEWSGTDWRLSYFRQPVADYVEDLQFRFNFEDGTYSDAPADTEAALAQSIDMAVLVRAEGAHLQSDKNQSYDLMGHIFSLNDKYQRANYSTVVQLRNLGGKI